MYRKDLITTELQKVAQAIAKILGLKQEGKIEEAHELIQHVFREELDFDKVDFDTISVKDFEVLLKQKQLSEKHLNYIAQLLFESAHPFREEDPGIINRLHLVLEVFNLLETEHHVQTLENINKRDVIDNFLNNNQYE
jgi:hypothetical protein